MSKYKPRRTERRQRVGLEAPRGGVLSTDHWFTVKGPTPEQIDEIKKTRPKKNRTPIHPFAAFFALRRGLRKRQAKQGVTE